MKRRTPPWRWSIGMLVAAIVVPDATSAAVYSFSNLMDNTVAGSYFGFGDVAVSGNRVVFKATFNASGFGAVDSIFTTTGGPRTKAVQEFTSSPPANGYAVPGVLSSLGRPAVDGDTIVFPAHVSGLFQGIEADALFSPGRIAVGTKYFGSYPFQYPYQSVADPRISDDVLMFRASLTSPSTPDSLYTKNGSRIVGVGDAAPAGGAFTAIDAEYASSGDTAAFRGIYGAEEGIFTGRSGSPLTTIAKTGDPTPIGGTFQSLLDPAIGGGNVAFLGASASGTGIFLGSGGALSTVVKTGDATPAGAAISALSTPAIGGDAIAFRADYAGGSGIYLKSGGNLTKVIETGDPLFGSAVTSFAFTDMGLDAGGSGNLGFAYALANGRTGVAMAYAGPPQPTIYRIDGTPLPDSAGLVTVPTVVLANLNLSSANLAGADLGGADAHSVNLTDANLNNAFLGDANLSQANLHGAQLVGARLAGANLSGANVRGANLTRVVSVTHCPGNDPFCIPTVDSSAGGITTTQLYQTSNYQARDLTDVRLPNNDLANANLAHQNLTGADLTGAWLAGAHLEGATIRGARFGRYAVTAGCDGKSAVDSCRTTTTVFGTGLSAAQLASTASYAAHDLAGVDFGGNNLAGADLSNQNLAGAMFLGTHLAGADLSAANIANVNFRTAVLTGANLFGADVRGADFASAVQTDAVLTNLIQPNGHVAGLDLTAGETLVVRDYDGDPDRNPPLPPIAVTIDQGFALSGGALRMVFEADAWDSTISFAPGISVARGGTLELAFAPDVTLSAQVGRTFDLFDWTGVAASGAFTVVSPYQWDLSQLYTTGQATLLSIGAAGDFDADGDVDGQDFLVWQRNPAIGRLADWKATFGTRSPIAGQAAVPEPSAAALLIAAALPIIARRPRSR